MLILPQIYCGPIHNRETKAYIQELTCPSSSVQGLKINPTLKDDVLEYLTNCDPVLCLDIHQRFPMLDPMGSDGNIWSVLDL